ncbi:MAG: SWIM zinc finger family protein [Cupriavidus necator]
MNGNMAAEISPARIERIEFLVQGSAESPYKLIFERQGSRIIAQCSCPAGENGSCCKHRLSILGGVDAGIVSENREEVALIASWLPGSDLAESMIELAEAERFLEEAKKSVTKAKKKLATRMIGR